MLKYKCTFKLSFKLICIVFNITKRLLLWQKKKNILT